ncbi:MAG: AhpC/TSA family protein [Bacteroidaceae bacterium]|nr:AhpC/TSA family protein [Bacteroidaceae bacterium]
MKINDIMTVAATFLVAIIFGACSDAPCYRIEGKTAVDDVGQMMYLKVYKSDKILDSAVVENHHFLFEGSVETPVMVTVSSDVSHGGWLFVLEGGEMLLSDTVDYAVGGGLNAELKSLFEALDSLDENKNKDEIKQLTIDCWNKHNDDALGAYVTSVAIYSLGAQFVDSLYQTAGEDIKDDVLFKMVKKNIEREKQTDVGQMFSDVTLLTVDGKEVELSNYVGKGKYVIMDCWASWCPPCRALISKLKDIYLSQQQKTFDIIGVATRDKLKNTRDAINELQIPWTVLSDDGMPTSIRDVYGFEGIPFVILFAPDGTILGRNIDETQIKQMIGM